MDIQKTMEKTSSDHPGFSGIHLPLSSREAKIQQQNQWEYWDAFQQRWRLEAKTMEKPWRQTCKYWTSLSKCRFIAGRISKNVGIFQPCLKQLVVVWLFGSYCEAIGRFNKLKIHVVSTVNGISKGAKSHLLITGNLTCPVADFA